jgi:hypothetical protein
LPDAGFDPIKQLQIASGSFWGPRSGNARGSFGRFDADYPTAMKAL